MHPSDWRDGPHHFLRAAELVEFTITAILVYFKAFLLIYS